MEPHQPAYWGLDPKQILINSSSVTSKDTDTILYFVLVKHMSTGLYVMRHYRKEGAKVACEYALGSLAVLLLKHEASPAQLRFLMAIR